MIIFSFFSRFCGNLILINEEQPQNAHSTILTTESEIVTFFKFLQLTKEQHPISITPGWKNISSNDEHPSKTILSTTVVDVGILNFLRFKKQEMALLPITWTIEGTKIDVSEVNRKNAKLPNFFLNR